MTKNFRVIVHCACSPGMVMTSSSNTHCYNTLEDIIYHLTKGLERMGTVWWEPQAMYTIR